ncbi:MAG: hypothetical protein HOP17_10570 [Acidobacteria bacterium]|nr:hypothetical protein [Acidobacteriota bacterium]
MRSLILIGAAMGAGFILLGLAARTPAQAALSNAVIAIGVAIVLLVIILSAIKYFGGPKT